MPVNHYAPSLVRISATFQSGSFYIDPVYIKLDVDDPNEAQSTYIYGTDDIVRESLGHFSFCYFAPTYGMYEYAWTVSGTIVGQKEGKFLVDPSEVF